MVEEAERGRDPMARMDVLKAIRWAIRAQHLDVTDNTVANCWIKSGLLGPVYTYAPAPKGHQQHQPDAVRLEVQSLLRRVAE